MNLQDAITATINALGFTPCEDGLICNEIRVMLNAEPFGPNTVKFSICESECAGGMEREYVIPHRTAVALAARLLISASEETPSHEMPTPMPDLQWRCEILKSLVRDSQSTCKDLHGLGVEARPYDCVSVFLAGLTVMVMSDKRWNTCLPIRAYRKTDRMGVEFKLYDYSGHRMIVEFFENGEVKITARREVEEWEVCV